MLSPWLFSWSIRRRVARSLERNVRISAPAASWGVHPIFPNSRGRRRLYDPRIGNRDTTPVRLAELVASLSLGIDLGFGQPMEHVLRQCLIALGLSEQLGLDEDERATIYYTALLVNVGCHSDAHEQARWFGDDIAIKATKYDYEPFSVRDAIGMVRLIGSGTTPLHRFRTGLEFAISGYREVSDHDGPSC